nr:hypothetical protein [Tanacetum cinerariifolium]
ELRIDGDGFLDISSLDSKFWVWWFNTSYPTYGYGVLKVYGGYGVSVFMDMAYPCPQFLESVDQNSFISVLFRITMWISHLMYGLFESRLSGMAKSPKTDGKNRKPNRLGRVQGRIGGFGYEAGHIFFTVHKRNHMFLTLFMSNEYSIADNQNPLVNLKNRWIILTGYLSSIGEDTGLEIINGYGYGFTKTQPKPDPLRSLVMSNGHCNENFEETLQHEPCVIFKEPKEVLEVRGQGELNTYKVLKAGLALGDLNSVKDLYDFKTLLDDVILG